MPVFLDPIPSGTIFDTLSEQVVVDLGLTVAASGTNTVSSDILTVIFEKSLSHLNRCLDTCFILENGAITPDPSKGELDLIVLQAECLLHKRQVELATTSAGRGVKRVKLEAIEVEFDSVDKTKNLDAKFGYCQELEDALIKYRVAQGTSEGAEIIWDGSTRRWEEVDHDNTTQDEVHYDQRPDGGKYPGVDPGDFDGGTSNRFGG